MQIGDKVYYNKGLCKLDVGEGIIKDIIKDGDRISLVVDNYIDYDKTPCICNGVLGSAFFLTVEDLRNHFGKTERKRQNSDLIRKSELVYRLKNKYPNLISDDMALYIFSLPEYDTEIAGELIEEDSGRKCNICGQELSNRIESINYCPNCGTRLNSTLAT